MHYYSIKFLKNFEIANNKPMAIVGEGGKFTNWMMIIFKILPNVWMVSNNNDIKL